MNKWKWTYSTLTASLLILTLLALLCWYQPWQYWKVEQLTYGLVNEDPSLRQQAVTTLLTWPTAQQENLLKNQKGFLLNSYEVAINRAIAENQWRNAQMWLMDLQKLYPYSSQVQLAQQEVMFNLAQQINFAVMNLNEVILNEKFLNKESLHKLIRAQNQLRELAPEHPLAKDRRILFLTLLSIDKALIDHDFLFAEKLTKWGLLQFPNENSLVDRQIQIHYQLPGEPIQVLASCISAGKNCWRIITATPLFSQPWLIQQANVYTSILDWNLITIMQNEIGQYYRQQALKAYEKKLPMLAAVELLRAAYFTSAVELDGYWQWLVRAFIERKQRETQQAQIASLSGLQHTLMTQLAAYDIHNAQRTILTLQAAGTDPFFIEGIALPALGDSYLDLANKLAQTQQYALAVRVLLAGQHFLPRNNEIKLLLTEYTALSAESITPEMASDEDILEAIWLEEYAQALKADAEEVIIENPVTTEFVDPCAQVMQMVTSYNAGVCQDELPDKTLGPVLVVVPANTTFNSFAITKYPITIYEYNNFCRLSRTCSPRVVAEENDNMTEQPTGRNDLLGNIDLTDVQEVMQDYDQYCAESGSCHTIEPRAHDKPITDITYQEALNYTEWLSTTTGYHYRLPTVAEWEYALHANYPEYSCSYDTILNLPKELVAVQRGTANDWGITFQMSFLREWVTTDQGLGLLGPEQPKELPACNIPLSNNATAVKNAENNVGFRLVREIWQ